ncbi:MAG TPA: hypothetical protein VFB26_12355 [Gaiellaceae bacterium]|nr:hypothetical protein [Gaiellaceae bacterium]
MGRVRAAPAALAALGLVAVAAAAPAGPPGQWSRLGKPSAGPAEPALARTPDGVLHVVSPAGAGTELWEARVAPDGHRLALARLPGRWRALSSPELGVAADGTLQLVVGAERSSDPSDPRSGIVLATASPGAPWQLADAPLVPGTGMATSDVGAATLPDGTPVVAWARSGSLRYRFGTTGARELALPDCCARRPDLAVDAITGRVVLAWVSLARGSGGVVAQAIGADGPAGRRLYAPGSAGLGRRDSVATESRTAVAARIGAQGVYVAYGHVARVAKPRRFVGIRLWRVGAPAPAVDLRAPDIGSVTLAAAPQGRLWLAWQRAGRLFAARTNRAATRVGAVRELPPPPRTGGVERMQGEGSAGPLDLVVDARGRGGLTVWHTRVLPGLTLRVRASTEAGGLARYRFAVLDAGDPVANAVVRVGAQSLVTGASGSVVLETSDRPGSATATKAGYAPAVVRVPAPARASG